jgi:cyclophilin family peptidyl-prolyl cis-trans isomerase
MTVRQTSVALAVLALATVAGRHLDARQSGGSLTVERIELAIDRIMAHRHYPGPTAQDIADRKMLAEALQSKTDAIRAVAVRAEGRLEDKSLAAVVMPFLKDSNADVRAEAGNALALMLRRAQPVDVAPVVEAILPRVGNSTEAEPWMSDTLGRLPYTREDADRVEAALVGAAQRSTGVEVAERGLVNLIARDRGRPVASETRTFLANRARGGDPWPIRLQAWRALQLLNEKDADLLAQGAAYHCTVTPDCGWQVREIAVDLMDAHDPTLATALAVARRDVSVNVRLSALRRQARVVTETKSCAPLLEAAGDANEPPTVRLEAVTLLDARCAGRETIVAQLSSLAAPLTGRAPGLDWHLSARALEALAKFSEVATRRILASASTHTVWQVRAAAARAAATLKDEPLLVAFSRDAESNVATEAVKALSALNSPQTTEVAIVALEARRSDYQLIRESAEALKKRGPSRAEVTPLLTALGRLTTEGKDTSRDPRTSILNRLKILAAEKDASGLSWVPGGVSALTPLLQDFDPDIAKLAATVLGVVNGTEPAIAPTERAPAQPTEAELRDAPVSATVDLTNGDHFEMRLLSQEAPVAVARFAKLVKAGYYDHLTFHRVEPLFVVQGGSPHANEYSGADRFLRDEVGLEHNVAGAVGLSTRGRDTGDGQIFIDLTDQYRLDFLYTVFARVPDVTVVTRILEGATIKRIVLGHR